MRNLIQQDRVKTFTAFLPGILIGALYGLLSRLFFGLGAASNLWFTMSCAFLLVVPLALGYLTVWLSPPSLQDSRNYAILAPWAACRRGNTGGGTAPWS